MTGKYSLELQCQECGHTFRTSRINPDCTKCGGSDLDLAPIKKAK